MRTLKVRDLLPLSQTEPAVVPAEASLREVAHKMVEDLKTREVYVVDRERRFLGVITLRRLARWAFASELPGELSPTELLDFLSSKTAGDLALRKPAYVREEDTLERLLGVMFRYDINEIPVVDAEGRIVGNLNMLELLKAWLEGRLGDLRR
jgi:CBS domain-containing protein